ncbi:hypothetical protein [Promicromonospora kroppenstedtii]|uniref:hypothetical protein n=1 Tax=Promicromonospora kroppenstedtii TaxID=440482 RepID=UPI00055CCE1A|nr:hypothetical protein [Promicromonospora kroppenstedtii]
MNQIAQAERLNLMLEAHAIMRHKAVCRITYCLPHDAFHVVRHGQQFKARHDDPLDAAIEAIRKMNNAPLLRSDPAPDIWALHWPRDKSKFSALMALRK